MPDSVTTNYHLLKPEISSSPDTWGNKLNGDLDLVDAQMKRNADDAANAAAAAAAAGVPIGGMVVWGTGTAPAHFFLCDGTVRANSAAPALAALFGVTFGGVSGSTFGVPDLRGGVPFGVAPGDPTTGTIGTHLGAAADPGSDFDFVVLNYIVRYQ